jgi:hypothetical protein
MRSWELLALPALSATMMFCTTSSAPAQVSVTIGAPPVCPYGYYDFAPYNCAPYGYYGPEWFSGGVFIGAGPWFHGGSHFVGHVDNHFDPRHGYHGPVPEHNEHPEAHHDVGHMESFHGNEMRDGRGHEAPHGR